MLYNKCWGKTLRQAQGDFDAAKNMIVILSGVDVIFCDARPFDRLRVTSGVRNSNIVYVFGLEYPEAERMNAFPTMGTLKEGGEN